MELKDVMNFKNFVVVGNTTNEEKYAYRIKKGLLKCGYEVSCVGTELASINDVPFEIDVLDLCIHPAKGMKLLESNQKKVKVVVIQPGAESEEIKAFLRNQHIDFLEDCVLLGLKRYKNYIE